MAIGHDLTTAQEIERKYDAAGDLVLPDAGGLLGAGADAAAEQQLLDAVYFDTPDLLLLRDGVTLRRRTGGPDAGWHLKLPAGRDHREELRLPLTRARRRPPAELVKLVRAHSRGGTLAPVAELTTRRRMWSRADADGRSLAEMVDDDVTARTFGDHPTNQHWREVEVELGAQGTTALLSEVETRLIDAGLRRSGASSKVGRALGSRAAVDPVAPGRTADAGAVVLGYLRTHAFELRRHDPLVRRDRPDAVHQMRVSARRMRSALQAFGRVLDPERTGPLVEELAWIGGELAPARDTEVLAAHIQEMLDGVPDDLLLGPVRASVVRAFARRQAEARTRALAALDSDRYLVLLRAVDAVLADPPLTGRAGRAARRELPRSVARVEQRLEQRISAVERAAAGPDQENALHAARKTAKRLRYATEAVIPVIGKPAVRLQRRLSDVQDLLGIHQDTVVARAALRDLAVAAHAEGGNGFTYGLLHAAEARRADDARAALPSVWRRMRRARSERWLGR